MARVNLGRVVPQKGVDYMTPEEQAQFEQDITTNVNNNIADFVLEEKQDIETTATNATTAFNENATSKTGDFNTNATTKTSDFNTNATNKTNSFDNNASSKTTTFNNNATDKTTAFNNNAVSKTQDFNDNAAAKQAQLDYDLTPYSKIVDTGSKIILSIDNTNYKMTASLKDKNNNVIDTSNEIDLPLESVVVNGSYDSVTKKVILTLENGNTVDFSVADLVSGLQTELSSSNKLPSDFVDTTNQANQFVTLAEKTTWNGKENATNKIATITSASTDIQYPSAKAVYDYVSGIVGDINTILDNINGEVV